MQYFDLAIISLYTVANFNDFAEAPAKTALFTVPVPEREETTPLLALDLVILDLVYNSVIQHQATLKVDVPVMMVETKSVLSAPLALERSEDRVKPSTESIPIPPASLALSTADLMVVFDFDSSTLIVDPARPATTTDFSFLETLL